MLSIQIMSNFDRPKAIRHKRGNLRQLVREVWFFFLTKEEKFDGVREETTAVPTEYFILPERNFQHTGTPFSGNFQLFIPFLPLSPLFTLLHFTLSDSKNAILIWSPRLRILLPDSSVLFLFLLRFFHFVSPLNAYFDPDILLILSVYFHLTFLHQ